MKLFSSVDNLRLRRRIAELLAAGMSRPAAERRARCDIGRDRARIIKGATGDWRDTIMTRGAVQ
jgi:hypothetical protein